MIQKGMYWVGCLETAQDRMILAPAHCTFAWDFIPMFWECPCMGTVTPAPWSCHIPVHRLTSAALED